MKTMHLTNAWHSASGGIATFYRAMLRAANQFERPLRLVVPGETGGVEDVGAYGRIYRVRSAPAPLNPAYRLILPGAYLGAGSVIRRILREERPDLIEICDKYTLPYLGGLLRECRVAGRDYRPTVVGLTCERMDDNVAAYLTGRTAGRRFSNTYMKWLYFPLFDHHIAISNHTAAELAHAARGHKVRRGVWVCPLGVDCEEFSPARRTAAERAAWAARAGGTPASTLLLYAGRLAREKNAGLVFETMDRLCRSGERDYRLLVAGGGSLATRLEAAWTPRLNGRVAFLGHIVDRAELAGLYAAADVFLHPNPREPFGIAPLEAMAAGLALVGPDSGGITTYAGAHNAWLAPPEPDAFAAAVREVFAAADARLKKLQAARATAERYSWEAVACRYFAVYDEMHGRRLGSASASRIPASFYSTPGNWAGMEV